MKKFLFTLAALLMAGSAFAANVYIADREFTAEEIGTQVWLDVMVQLDNEYMNAWDFTFTYPEGLNVTSSIKKNNAVLKQTAITNEFGDEEDVSFTVNGDAYHTAAFCAQAGYWDPDDDGEYEMYGAVKIGPTGEFMVYQIRVQPTEEFTGGNIEIAWMVSGGFDNRNGQTKMQVEGTTTVALTVAGGTEPEVTEKPVITWEANDEAQEVVITVTGAGELVLYNDDVEVARGESPLTYTVPYTDDPEGEEMGFSATAQEEGKEVSEYALATVEVPGKTPVEPEKTETPVITYDEDTFTVTATGAGEVKLYVNGEEVENPYTFELGEEETTYTVTATAQEEGKEISETAELEVTVPAAPVVIDVTPKPIIDVIDDPETETVTVRATGYGHICIYWDDMLQAEGEGVAEWVIPYGDDPEGEEYGVSATAQEEGYEVSEYALATVFVPGKSGEEPPYETPAPEVNTEMTDDAFVITATGEGTVTVYVQYINMETGEMTTETYEGDGTVTVTIPRGEEDAYINYWAVAQADEDAVPGETDVEYFFEIPAKEVTPDPSDHNEGVWIVTYLADGSEQWDRMLKSNDDYTCIVRFSYGTYGTFDYDPNLSMAENDKNRPNELFYIVIDGVRYGAVEGDETVCVLGTAMSNPIEVNENHYMLENALGRVYNMGVAFNEYDLSQPMYVYAAVAAYTDVNEVNADKAVAGVRYFNMAGQEMQEANGMTIVVTTYTDGTTSAVKVIK